MFNKCSKIITETGKICGDDINSPFHIRFCSEECIDRTNKAELENLGITPIMMKEALTDYYKCRGLIEQQRMDNNLSETPIPYHITPTIEIDKTTT